MKHVRKKFVNATKLSENVVKVLDSAKPNFEAVSKIQETNYANHAVFIQTDGDELIQAFKYFKGKQPYLIPEPNPIVIYFETGRQSFKQIPETREKLFSELDQIYSTLNNFYPFYIHASTCVVFLFNSIEAFINGVIPNNYVYSRKLKNKTESFDRQQIQSTIPFEEKIKNVIFDITKKSFHSEFGNKYENIKKLKDFRDAIMHTKSDDGKPPKVYEDLYTCALDFNYTATIQHVRDFLNYYQPGIIEDCSCGQDF
ncbi:MAG TPA: hypothetical protein VNX01_15095 [Bacteroidia bacterium]|jgi:hypothetical protein|nr:hypothetical protein [Bacteroidia bacterium]